MENKKTTYISIIFLITLGLISAFLKINFWFSGINFVVFSIVGTLASRSSLKFLTKRNFSFLFINLLILALSIYAISKNLDPIYKTIYKDDSIAVFSYETQTDNTVTFTKAERYFLFFSREQCLLVIHPGFKGQYNEMNASVEDGYLKVDDGRFSLTSVDTDYSCKEMY